MSKAIILILVAVAITAFATGSHCSAQEPAAGAVGRYQLVRVSDDRVFLIDTATAQCWSQAHGVWRDEGKPTTTKVERSARPTKGPAATLVLPEKSVELIVVQREERAIPGSNGSVRIRLGDITDGQVHLSVVTSDEVDLLERTSASQGDNVEFSLGKKKYVLHIKQLRNILFGDDFATIEVREGAEDNPPKKRRTPDQVR